MECIVKTLRGTRCKNSAIKGTGTDKCKIHSIVKTQKLKKSVKNKESSVPKTKVKTNMSSSRVTISAAKYVVLEAPYFHRLDIEKLQKELEDRCFDFYIIGYILNGKYKSITHPEVSKKERLEARKIFSDPKHHINNYNSSIILYDGSDTLNLSDVNETVAIMKDMDYCSIFGIMSLGYERFEGPAVRDPVNKLGTIDAIYVEVDAESG